jgi:hypothetical protein
VFCTLGLARSLCAVRVFHPNLLIFRTYEAYTECQIIATPEKYDVKPYAYGFQKDSPYLGPFNYYLKQLRERGATKQIVEKYESRPQVSFQTHFLFDLSKYYLQ